MSLITVACVEWGNYQGRGAEYVGKLAGMVARHLSIPHRFYCHRPSLTGWWGKVELFQPGLFEGRVLYLDLDTVVTGALDPLAASPGLLHLDRWGWKEKVYGSGVMVWDAGEHADIWQRFTPEVAQHYEGDQNWIQRCGEWPALPDGLCVSYRYHCKPSPPARGGVAQGAGVVGPPPGASVVCFHGQPKPHECSEDWVKEAWRA